MSTKYAVTLCDNNERASNIFEIFLDSCNKFDSLDVMGGARIYNNYLKHYVKNVNDISIIKNRFLNNYNMYFASSLNEDAGDIPKNNAFMQNMAEMHSIVVLANGKIKNKEYIAKVYEFDVGQSLQEFILNYYYKLYDKNIKDIIPNMIREFNSDQLSFIIFNKNLNELYVYNKGDNLYLCNLPGMSIVISTEILPINTHYPHYNFHKLDSSCALKIDSKTLFIQNIPINCNTFNFGKDLNIDSNKGILFTETCDMEYYAALSVLTNKNVTNITDLQTIYFGFDSDIDKIVFDKITKLKKEMNIIGKLPIHIKYDFENIYETESNVIEKINDNSNEIDENTSKKKKKKKQDLTIKDNSLYISRKLNYIATCLVNYALSKGIGSIYIPNINRRNNRLISIIKTLLSVQTHIPIYVYSIFDEFNTMDIIHFTINCKQLKDIDKTLVNCDRNSLSIESDELGNTTLKYNIESDYNYDICRAFEKCGMENPFNKYYIGRDRIDNIYINANIVPDKYFDNERRAALLADIDEITKNAVLYQKKLLSY